MCSSVSLACSTWAWADVGRSTAATEGRSAHLHQVVGGDRHAYALEANIHPPPWQCLHMHQSRHVGVQRWGAKRRPLLGSPDSAAAEQLTAQQQVNWQSVRIDCAHEIKSRLWRCPGPSSSCTPRSRVMLQPLQPQAGTRPALRWMCRTMCLMRTHDHQSQPSRRYLQPVQYLQRCSILRGAGAGTLTGALTPAAGRLRIAHLRRIGFHANKEKSYNARYWHETKSLNLVVQNVW